MFSKHRIVNIFFYGGYVFLYLPILLVIVYSFNASSSLSWGGLSLKWYRELMHQHGLLDSLVISLKIAVISATFSVILGTLCASGWSHHHKALGFFSTMPLVIPEVVLGLALLLFFFWVQVQTGWPPRGMLTVVVAHTTLGMAYVTAMVRARLIGMDPLLREAALDLGARPYKVFLRITLPLLAPVLFASWLIAFILSLDDVILASFTSGPGTTTLPLLIFSSLKVGYSPQINALATCIVLVVSLLIAIAGWVYQKKKQGDFT